MLQKRDSGDYTDLSEAFISKRLGKVTGKALVRVDINVPIRDGKVNRNNLRFKACARSIQAYIDNGIIPIILSHQGRRGDSDYLESMEQHAEVLSSLLRGANVIYSDSLADSRTAERAGKLRQGDVLVIKNVRDDPDEKREFRSGGELHGCNMVKTLSKIADIYINDAPATMHRSDASLVGFVGVMPSYLGLLMEDEINTLNEIKANLKSGKKTAIIFGGKKWEKFDYIYQIAKNKNVKILCGGVPGQSLSYVENKDSFNRENEEFILESGSLDIAEKLINEFGDRIIKPVDFILENGENVSVLDLKLKTESIADIGEETLNQFFRAIDNAKMIIYAGPVGRYEKGYNQTVRLITRFMGEKALNYTLGGNSADSMDDIGLDKVYEMLKGKRITSGGSGLAFIADKELPVINAFLKK